MKNENKSGILECGPTRCTEPRTLRGPPGPGACTAGAGSALTRCTGEAHGACAVGGSWAKGPAQARRVSPLHLAQFLGSVPLKYSGSSVLSAPHSQQDFAMPPEEGAQARV